MGGWSRRLEEMDAVVNLTGFGLEHWPWTRSMKERFHDSRVLPGLALVAAIKACKHRPGVFLQVSGINRYGLHGEAADESTPPAGDYLAQLTVQWEAATQPVEELGVRRVVARTAVVLDARAGLFPLMALPVRMFAGGPLGDGQQCMPWVHLADEVGALRFLLEDRNMHGAFNLIAPAQTSNADFMRAVAKALRRPYWLPVPAWLFRMLLGEMSVLIVDGRYAVPGRLLEAGYPFQFPDLDSALANLFR